VLENSGNYVLNKMLETLSLEKVKFLLFEIENHIKVLVLRSYGCKIILRILENF
jgi:hypothetical protein